MMMNLNLYSARTIEKYSKALTDIKLKLMNKMHFQYTLTRIELNSLYICKLSFKEKKSLLSFEDANHRKEKFTATCQLN